MYFLIAAAVVAGVAAWTDARTGHIPNWLTFGTLGVALVGHAALAWHVQHSWRAGMAELGYSLVGAIACALVPAFMYWRGAIGGGDIKLFAAIGALCHPMIGLEMETYAFVAAAILAPAKMAYEGTLFKTLGRSLALATNPFRKAENRKELPPEMMTWFRLGPAIFLGAAATVLLHWEMPR
jgi:prepilin peptidase CpaA